MDLDRDLVHIMLVMAQDMKVNGLMMEKRGWVSFSILMGIITKV
jgi:hypothetical protein